MACVTALRRFVTNTAGEAAATDKFGDQQHLGVPQQHLQLPGGLCHPQRCDGRGEPHQRQSVQAIALSARQSGSCEARSFDARLQLEPLSALPFRKFSPSPKWKAIGRPRKVSGSPSPEGNVAFPMCCMYGTRSPRSRRTAPTGVRSLKPLPTRKMRVVRAKGDRFARDVTRVEEEHETTRAWIAWPGVPTRGSPKA